MRGDADEILPLWVWKRFLVPLCSRRWLSLTQRGGEDDYFSEDLDDEMLQTTFGAVGAKQVPLLILNSARDEVVPVRVNQKALIERWTEVVQAAGGEVDEGSGIIEWAGHKLLNRVGVDAETNAKILDELVERVGGFLEKIERGRVERIINP